MLRTVPIGVLTAAIFGQFAASFGAGLLGAFAIPCCDNPMPALPRWYSNLSVPVYFAVMLVPAFLCGLYVTARPILVAAIAAGAGKFLWSWLGAYILAQLFPARALGGLGQLQSVFWSITSLEFVATLAVSSVCYAAAGAAAASGGYLLRSRVRPNHAFNRTRLRRAG